MVRKILVGAILSLGCFGVFLWRFTTRLPEGFDFRLESFADLKVVRKERTEEESVLVRARNRFSGAIYRVMPEEEASLGVGYLLGIKEGLSKEVKEMLSLVGLSHIVVASGTHLGILVGFFRKVFGKISRFAGLLFALAFVVLFGMMIGWTPSITRAGIVTIISLLLWYVGEQAKPGRVILFAAGVTLMIEPLYVFDLGWQLSFASFLGILVLAPLILEHFYGAERPWLTRKERKKTEASEVTKAGVASVAATVMVAPILLYNFGSLSIISVVANVLILPTMAGVMGVTFLAGVLALAGLEFGAEVLGQIATWGVDYHLAVMKFFSERTEFLFQGFRGDFRVFLAYLPVFGLILVGVSIRAKKRRKVTEKIRQNPGKYLRWSRPVKRTEPLKNPQKTRRAGDGLRQEVEGV